MLLFTSKLQKYRVYQSRKTIRDLAGRNFVLENERKIGQIINYDLCVLFCLLFIPRPIPTRRQNVNGGRHPIASKVFFYQQSSIASAFHDAHTVRRPLHKMVPWERIREVLKTVANTLFLKVLTNEKRDGLKVVSFDRSC
jgi:hypothetical protein